MNLSGYIVALPKHPGNSLADTVETLRNRPRQLLRLMDALLADVTLSAAIAREPVTAIGHSMGGYAVLWRLPAASFSRLTHYRPSPRPSLRLRACRIVHRSRFRQCPTPDIFRF